MKFFKIPQRKTLFEQKLTITLYTATEKKSQDKYDIKERICRYKETMSKKQIMQIGNIIGRNIENKYVDNN